MIALEFIVVLAFILLGARLGSSSARRWRRGAILGVTVSADQMPVDVITIIMAVIAAIATMQVVGGMDYLVRLAERFCGKTRNTSTSCIYCHVPDDNIYRHTAFSMIPVITEVAKRTISAVAPLSIAVPASQMAITARRFGRRGGILGDAGSRWSRLFAAAGNRDSGDVHCLYGHGGS